MNDDEPKDDRAEEVQTIDRLSATYYAASESLEYLLKKPQAAFLQETKAEVELARVKFEMAASRLREALALLEAQDRRNYAIQSTVAAAEERAERKAFSTEQITIAKAQQTLAEGEAEQRRLFSVEQATRAKARETVADADRKSRRTTDTIVIASTIIIMIAAIAQGTFAGALYYLQKYITDHPPPVTTCAPHGP